MHKLSRRAAVVSVATILSMISFAASANHSWNGYHWARMSNPFTLDLGDNVDSGWDPYFATASSDWSQSTMFDTTIVTGGSNPKNCKATTGRVEVCNNTYGYNGWLGVAGIYVSGKHITAAYVKLNDSYFNSSTYGAPEWRQMVVCQEVGHTFGLDHQDETFSNTNLGTCMDYTDNPLGPPSNEHPNKHDYDELVTIYSHVDSTTTIINSTGGGSDGGGGGGSCNPHKPGCTGASNDPSGWGRLVSTSHDGHQQVFELDLGNGRKMITHVLWAEPHGRASLR